MSDCKTTVEKILKVEKHFNADRLDVVTIRGWECIVSRDSFKVGDLCVYIPIDSVLPSDLEAFIFKNSKIQLSKSRVKTIKLRGVFSQGLVVPVDKIFSFMKESQKKINPHHPYVKNMKEGDELTEKLSIIKYEPKKPKYQQNQKNGKKKTKLNPNPFFDKYQSLQNIKNYSNAIDPDEHVIVMEKIHGTNFRAGWVPNRKDTLWKKIKSFFGFLPEWEFIVGSRNVQLQDKKSSFYGRNIYKDIADKYNLKECIPEGMIYYGEVYGEGIQKGYDYGTKEHKLIMFDIKVYDDETKAFKYLKYEDFVLELLLTIDKDVTIDFAPVLFKGKMKDIPEDIFGNSVLCPDQKVMEGVVIWCDNSQMRKLKYLNPEYLINKNNTDYH